MKVTSQSAMFVDRSGLTIGLCSTGALLGAADCPVSPQVVVEASVGVKLVLGKSCTGNSEP